MSDIYCPHCGEPWDLYELHDVPSVTPDIGAGVLTYKQAAKLFPYYGCGLWVDRFDGGMFKECKAEMVDDVRAEHAKVMHSISPFPDDWL